MFSGMDAPRHSQRFLRGRNRLIINPAGREDVEAGADLRARKQRESRAPGPAMQVQAKVRSKVAQRAYGRGQGIVEHRRKAVFHYHANLQIGPIVSQQLQRGRAQHAVAERSQPDYSDPASRGESVDGV